MWYNKSWIAEKELHVQMKRFNKQQFRRSFTGDVAGQKPVRMSTGLGTMMQKKVVYDNKARFEKKRTGSVKTGLYNCRNLFWSFTIIGSYNIFV